MLQAQNLGLLAHLSHGLSDFSAFCCFSSITAVPKYKRNFILPYEKTQMKFSSIFTAYKNTNWRFLFLFLTFVARKVSLIRPQVDFISKDGRVSKSDNYCSSSSSNRRRRRREKQLFCPFCSKKRLL